MRKIVQISSTAALLTAILGGTAYAATSTTSFTVSATVADSCSVSATNLAFGNVTPVDNINFNATSTVDVTCANGTTYDIGLDAGANSSDGTVSTRRMTDGAATPNYLSYQMYQDSGHTTVWGNTVGTDTVAATGTGSTQTNTVYGQIPSGQQATPTGSYTDTVTVTVTF